MKNILFPTEFSDHAPEKFKFALELAYAFNARLVLMHAFSQPEVNLVSQSEMVKMGDDVVKLLVDFAGANLPEMYQNLKIIYIAKAGFASESILDVAFNEDIDLIVMGMTGKTNAMDTIFGSTAMDILARADCPVLLIPASTKFEGIDNMVYTTNFKFRDLEAINFLHKWSKVLDAPIHCLHVLEQDENELRMIKNMHILKETYKWKKMIRFGMVQGDFRAGIEKFAKGKKADIVAMMSHKRNLILRLIEGSQVKGIARRIHIPLLVIKDNSYEWENRSSEWIEIANSIA